jgi:hypothetical protein
MPITGTIALLLIPVWKKNFSGGKQKAGAEANSVGH